MLDGEVEFTEGFLTVGFKGHFNTTRECPLANPLFERDSGTHGVIVIMGDGDGLGNEFLDALRLDFLSGDLEELFEVSIDLLGDGEFFRLFDYQSDLC